MITLLLLFQVITGPVPAPSTPGQRAIYAKVVQQSRTVESSHVTQAIGLAYRNVRSCYNQMADKTDHCAAVIKKLDDAIASKK